MIKIQLCIIAFIKIVYFINVAQILKPFSTKLYIFKEHHRFPANHLNSQKFEHVLFNLRFCIKFCLEFGAE